VSICFGWDDGEGVVLMVFLARIPRPKGEDGEVEEAMLPQTLVRIPIQQAEAAARELAKSGDGDGE
jgi:hypothetical protein